MHSASFNQEKKICDVIFTLVHAIIISIFEVLHILEITLDKLSYDLFPYALFPVSSLLSSHIL